MSSATADDHHASAVRKCHWQWHAAHVDATGRLPSVFTRVDVDGLQLSPHVARGVLVLMGEVPVFVGHVGLFDEDDV